jgi:hypothetical protein
MTPKETAADIVSAAAVVALNMPGPAVGSVHTDALRDDIEIAIRAAVMDEREACAKVADHVAEEVSGDGGEAWRVAEEIRARSNRQQ